jgi:hypothetical protein
MRTFVISLIGIVLLASTVLAEKIPVEGWYKSLGGKRGDSWLDSGMRRHFIDFNTTADVTLYGEEFGLKAKVQADWALSMLDKVMNGSIVSRQIWTSEDDPETKFVGHTKCDLTSGSATCVMWFKGFGEYEGKIMELTFNEKDAAETEGDNNPNLYMLEGIVMDEPADD